MGRIIAISNLKGGIGKTTTVVNLGAGLALKGARVLMVDVDAQGNLAMALGLKPRRTIYEALVDNVPAADCITPARPNLDLIAGDATLLGAQPAIAKRPDWSRVLKKAIDPLVSQYDFVIIDSAGSLTPLNVNALVAANDVIAPTAIEHFSISSLDLLFQQVTRVKGGNGSIRMIVPTMFDPRVKQSSELMDGLRERYGTLIAPPIRVNVRLSEAPRYGQTIYEFDPKSRGALDYAQLVEAVSKSFAFHPQPAARPTAEKPSAVQPLPPVSTNTAPRDPTPALPTTPIRIGQTDVKRCPNCNHPLFTTTAAGYNIVFCENCKYQAQTLAREIRQ